MYMGDGTHNPNSVVPIAYHGPTIARPACNLLCCRGNMLRHGRAWLHAYEKGALALTAKRDPK